MTAHLRRPLRRKAVLAGLVAALGALVGPAGLAGAVAPAAPDHGHGAAGVIMDANHPDAVPNRYIVVLRDRAEVTGLAARYGATVHFTYRAALNGMAIEADAASARKLAADPAVAYVEQDRTVTMADDLLGMTLPDSAGPAAGIDAVQPNPPSWGMDRIDERSLPVDLKYHYPNTAPSVTAYIIGTGIRYTHQEFGGRASLGVDTVGDGQNGNDCQGLGTFLSGVVGGSTVGIAKSVRLRSVRVLNCAGSGTFSQVIAGVDWVTADAAASGRPSVANMALGGGPNQALDDAVTRSIAANVHYTVAAGSSVADACNFSPARVPRATTVGTTDQNDVRASFSNFGRCLDLFAPGMSIYSSWSTADNAYNTISGTSPSTAHATGVAALWRQKFPADNADAVATALAANATPGIVGNPGTGSPNLLLFSGMIPV